MKHFLLLLLLIIGSISLYGSGDDLSVSKGTDEDVINGYQLPPEPDTVINNSTLLGIDSNNNGVRDDVERLIISEEAKHPHFPKTHTALSLQYAWAWQKIMVAPIM